MCDKPFLSIVFLSSVELVKSNTTYEEKYQAGNASEKVMLELHSVHNDEARKKRTWDRRTLKAASHDAT